MKQTVHFSKTEKLPDGSWVLTVPNKGMEKTETGQFAYIPQQDDTIRGTETRLYVASATVKGETIEIIAYCTTISGPGVGREYTIERK